MRIALLILFLATGVWADTCTIPSPNPRLSIRYEFIDDSESHTENTQRATLNRDGVSVWSFAGKGRVIEFSWSPAARYLVFGVVLPGRDMALYYLDTCGESPREHKLDLNAIEERVEAAALERPSGTLASRSQIDFLRVRWISDSRCRLHYFYRFDRKAADAELALDLASPIPELKIITIPSVSD